MLIMSVKTSIAQLLLNFQFIVIINLDNKLKYKVGFFKTLYFYNFTKKIYKSLNYVYQFVIILILFYLINKHQELVTYFENIKKNQFNSYVKNIINFIIDLYYCILLNSLFRMKTIICNLCCLIKEKHFIGVKNNNKTTLLEILTY